MAPFVRFTITYRLLFDGTVTILSPKISGQNVWSRTESPLGQFDPVSDKIELVSPIDPEARFVCASALAQEVLVRIGLFLSAAPRWADIVLSGGHDAGGNIIYEACYRLRIDYDGEDQAQIDGACLLLRDRELSYDDDLGPLLAQEGELQIVYRTGGLHLAHGDPSVALWGRQIMALDEATLGDLLLPSAQASLA
jgi:hypothetical protein